MTEADSPANVPPWLRSIARVALPVAGVAFLVLLANAVLGFPLASRDLTLAAALILILASIVGMALQASGLKRAEQAFLERERRQREVEASLQKTSRTLQTLIDASPLAIVVLSPEAHVRLWSPAAERMFGWSAEEVIGRLAPYIPEPEVCDVNLAIMARQPGVERRRRRKDGSVIDVTLWSAPLHDASGAVIGALGILADMTAQHRLERQIRQAQKLDALGSIAGGIAHDFNNILTVLRGNLALMKEQLAGEEAVRDNLAEMDKACYRAATLVRQILTFGGRQEQSRTITSLKPTVMDALQLLRSTLPASIAINTHIAPMLPTVLADSGQIHQVIMNLAINASQAIEGQRGLIEVSLEAVDIDEALAATTPELHVGRYVRLTVSDSGKGMSVDVLDRIFEPFFTTKAPGRGTGLGLPVVRGIVRNHDGAITVWSEPGKGTRFDVYFPVVEGDIGKRQEQAVQEFRGRSERILYLDDEVPIVQLASRMLKRLGYEVEGHTRAPDALKAFRSNPSAYDLVVTDLAMPGASGLDFARDVLAIRPEIPVVLTTGYIDPDDQERAERVGIREVVLKPATIEELGRVFHRLLAGRAEALVDR